MLAYVSVDLETFNETLVARDLRSGKEHVLVPAGGPLVLMQSLTWSPDGRTLAFAASDLSTGQSIKGRTAFAAQLEAHPTLQDLWLVEADGSGLHRLSELIESSPSIAWSADGESIFVMAASGFWRFDRTTGTRENIGEGVPAGQIVRIP
jgi:Tol biopolymer transport system component